VAVLADGAVRHVAGDNSKFNGKIDLVQIDLGDDNHDHLIDPEEIVRIAFARQ
jgi:hypothetical protein